MARITDKNTGGCSVVGQQNQDTKSRENEQKSGCFTCETFSRVPRLPTWTAQRGHTPKTYQVGLP